MLVKTGNGHTAKSAEVIMSLGKAVWLGKNRGYCSSAFAFLFFVYFLELYNVGL